MDVSYIKMWIHTMKAYQAMAKARAMKEIRI